MRSEYDFSQGTRGKHAGKRLRIVGDKSLRGTLNTAARIQKVIERELTKRADFNAIWRELAPGEKEKIRAGWLKKINSVLQEQPSS
jgi:hypothetical protein